MQPGRLWTPAQLQFQDAQVRRAVLRVTRPPRGLRAANRGRPYYGPPTDVLGSGDLGGAGYGRGMQDAAEVQRRKRRCNRAVLLGIALMALALVVSSHSRLPAGITTLAAVVGFALVMYGVHVGWLVFYDRESDGPAS